MLHIYDVEWETKRTREIWESVILSNLGIYFSIYARDTTIKEIDKTTAFKFLEDNHLQGGVYSQISLGL